MSTNPVRVITREQSDRRISLTVCVSTGEILRYAQNDVECVYVVLLLARFFASLRMTVVAFLLVLLISTNSNLHKSLKIHS